MRSVLAGLLACASLALVGCASQILNSYVGKDVRQAVVKYGPPANALDMGDGRRAFQWVMNSSYTTPVNATTTGTVNSSGPTAWYTSNTLITGGQTFSYRCVYTLYAKWEEARQGWIGVGYETPNIMCQ